MEKLKIIVERGKDFVDAYAENYEGVYGAGESVAEAKQNVLEAIELLRANSANVPEILKGKYEVEYIFDTHVKTAQPSKDFYKAAQACNATSVDNFFDEVDSRIKKHFR